MNANWQLYLQDNLNADKGVIILDSVSLNLTAAEFDTVSSLIKEDAFSDNKEFDNCVTQLDNSTPFSDDEEFLRLSHSLKTLHCQKKQMTLFLL